MGDPISRSSYEGGYQPSPIVRPERTFADGRWTVILTRELSHPVQRVWAALTEPAQLQQWAPFVSDRNLTETGVVAVTMLGATTGIGERAVQRQVSNHLDGCWSLIRRGCWCSSGVLTCFVGSSPLLRPAPSWC